MKDQSPDRFLKRRAFLADIAAAGAVILGSAVWAMSTRTVDASPAATPSAKGPKSPSCAKTPVPRETDHVHLDGDVAPVRSPSPKPKTPPKPSPAPSTDASCAPPPREGDTVPLGGKPKAPPSPPKSPNPSPKPR